MKRGLKIFFSILFLLVALILFFYEKFNITGFAISNSVSSYTFSFFGLLSFMISIMLFASTRSDSLQALLEEMESKNPSPSLANERNKKQTLREKFQFGLRNMFGLVKRVEQTKSYDSDSDYHQADGYRFPDYKTRYALENRVHVEKQKQEGLSKYRENRAEMTGALNRLRDREVVQGELITEGSVDQFMKKLQEETKTLGIPFNSDRYGTLLKKYLPGYLQKNLDAAGQDIIDYLKTNSERVNTTELGEKLRRLSNVITHSGIDRSSLQGIPKDENEAFQYYKENARTMSISDFEKQHGKTIISGVPYKMPDREFLNNEQLRNRATRHMSYRQFIRANLTGDFMQSSSAVDKDSKESEFFSPIGLIMGEGKIYDASPEDITSQSKNGSRIAWNNVGGFKDSPVEERAREALRPTRNWGSWNEYIVGSTKPKGIYFLRSQIEARKNMKSLSQEENVSPEETIRNLAKTGEEYGLQLYEFKTGEGFIEIPDVDKYLKPSRRVYAHKKK